MTFARLRLADWVVFVAALALLFTTAPDWYSTTRGEEARQIQKQAGSSNGQAEREVEHDAGALAEGQERNAWQEDGLIDRIILIALLATSALGVLAAFWRASGRGRTASDVRARGTRGVRHRPARAVPGDPGARLRRAERRSRSAPRSRSASWA